MSDPGPGSFPSRIAAALTAALLLCGLPAAGEATSSSALSPAAPTVSQCEAEWGKSQADAECQNESVTVNGIMCRVEAECLVPIASLPISNDTPVADTYSSTEVEAALHEVSGLNNCGGELTVGSC